MKLQAYIEAFKSLPADIKQGEAHLEVQSQKSLSVQDGLVKATESFNRNVLYVRATGTNTGIAYTENISEEPLSVMRRVIENSRLVTKNQNITFTPPGLAYPNHPRPAKEAPAFTELLVAAVALEKKAQSLCRGAKLANCTLSHTRNEDEVANSLGLDVESSCSYYTLELQVISQVNDKMGEKNLTLYSESLDGFKIEDGMRDVLQIARLQAAPSAFPSGKVDLILSKLATHEFLFMLWRSMSAIQNRQSGATFAGKIGQKTGDSCVSIVSSNAHPACPIRYCIDVEGMPVSETRLMDRGVFKTLLHNRLTARETGVSSTGNAGRHGTVPVPVLVTPKVLWVEAGEKSHAELMEQLKDGLMITSILDAYHGIDYSSGEFSVPVMGLVIKDGNVCAATQSLVWTGNLKDVLNKTQAVGREMYFSYSRFMRDNFVLGGPDMLVRNQAIASPD
jgi:predicted Zn-dependent protease